MRARRHMSSGVSLFQSAPWRAFLRDMGLIVLTFVLGYGISALDTATVPDLTSIPLAIVDRVEILRDGGSPVTT